MRWAAAWKRWNTRLPASCSARWSRGTVVPHGARVPGTQFQLDPVQAAFNIGTLIRWLDFNDTWLAAEWGHPSDNLGGILAVADWASRTAVEAAVTLHRQMKDAGKTVQDIQKVVIRTHEACIRIIDKQAGAARESGRPLSLHPVHGGGAADPRQPHGGRLRGRCCRPTHRRAAREDRVRGRSAVHERLSRPRQAQ